MEETPSQKGSLSRQIATETGEEGERGTGEGRRGGGGRNLISRETVGSTESTDFLKWLAFTQLGGGKRLQVERVPLAKQTNREGAGQMVLWKSDQGIMLSLHVPIT